MVSRLAVLTAFVSALSIGVAAAPLSGNETEVLVARQLGNTANDVTNRVCRSTTLLFARGTTESGNIGGVRTACHHAVELKLINALVFQTVGPALGDALKSALGASNVAVQGIDYPADLGGLTIGQTNPASAQGSIDCSNKVAALLSYCPSTRIVITGYSQGAQQVHGCLLRLSQTQANSVKVCQPRLNVAEH